ncbi:MAG: branched-chain amino acid transport system permease protein [Actinomycetota bacterium]
MQLLVAGLAVGALYSLVALGFVIIYKATGVINFAQGALLLLGAYFALSFNETFNLPFLLAALLAMAACAIVGVLVERLILSRMVGQPVFAVIMITLGLTIFIEQIVTWRWGGQRNLADPWGLDTFTVADVVIPVVNVVRIAAAAVLLGGFFAFFRYSRLGVAMRATASDQEAALAQGISARRIFALSWAVAAAIAALAGVLLASGGRGLDPSLGVVALVAFPAIILGGLDSPGGAVVGGAVMGVVETMTSGYSDKLPEFLGHNFHRVTPYVVLVAILLIRPYGLFGTPEVRRV